MGESNGNVKWWQLLVLLISLASIIGSAAGFGAKEIILNDRLRASEDRDIRCEIERLRQDFYDKVSSIDIKLMKITTYLKQ